MVLKRWFYILVAAWLINVLVCFHPAEAFESVGNARPAKSGILLSKSSLVSLIVNHFTKQEDHPKEGRKITHRKRFINNRSSNYDLQLPVVDAWSPQVLVKLILFDPTSVGRKVYFLPPHYNFLFRLSPF